jgi:hypothetical protein
MSFYYQSTIIYFVIFIIYLLFRGSFAEDSYSLVTHDPIIYFFAIIVLVALISLLYNLFKNRHLKITDDGIQFIDRFGSKTINIDDIENIRLGRESGRFRNIASRQIKIKIKNRRRRFLIRPNDYENAGDLIYKFRDLKRRIETK